MRLTRSSLLHPSAVLAGFVLLACRSVPAGPPPPDAEAIVTGAAGPGVAVDSIDAPFTASIEKGRFRARGDAGGSTHDFWGEVAHLDVVHAAPLATSLDERTFVEALRKLMDGDPESAAIAFGALHRIASDPAVRSRARVGLTMSLTWMSDWASIAAMAADPDSLELHDPRVDQAGVERWAHAFAGIPPATVSLPDQSVTLPLRRSAFGTPVVTVMVNGHPHEFWLDTGASMTLLSAETAIADGIRLAARDTLALGVVGGHIDARAIFIDSLAIGGFMAHGLTAAVVNGDMLRLDQYTERGVTHSIRIAGVIGADLIRRMDLVIDAAAGTLTISRPRRSPPSVRNLFWVGYPVVRLVSRDGQPLLFGLDTGAEGSYLTTTLLRKLPRTPIAARRGSIGGLGTARTETEWVVRDLKVSDGDYAIALRNTPVLPERRWTFVSFDGVIGSDIALGTRLHLDFTNGIFDVRPSAANESRLGPKVIVEP